MKNSVDSLILEGLYRKQPLSQIMEAVAAETEISLCLYSPDLRPLLFVGDRELEQRFYTHILQFFELPFSQRLSYSAVQTEDGAMIRCLVLQDRSIAALLIIHIADPDVEPEEMRDLANRLSKLCSLFTVPDTGAALHNNFESFRLANLILNTGTDSGSPLETESLVRIKGNYVVCAFSPAQEDRDRLTGAEQELEHNFRNCLHIKRNNRLLVLLYQLPAMSSAEQELVDKVREYCTRNELNCGMSLFFRDLRDRNFYIRQAGECLQWTEPDCNTAYAGNLFCDLFLHHAINPDEKELYILQNLRKLTEYDQENGGSYYQTLKTYLRCHSRVNAAADSLYIDHSTMNYRLKKINSLLNGDLNEDTLANALRISMRIMDADIKERKEQPN